MEDCLQCVHRTQNDHRTEYVKADMGCRQPLGLLAGAQTAQHHGDTLADILSDYDRKTGRKCQAAGRKCQRLQDTYGCRRTLQDHGYNHTHKKSQKRVRKSDEQTLELCGRTQRGQRSLHGRHTDKQNTKSHEDTGHAVNLLLLGDQHDKGCATHQERCQRGRLEQLE